MTVAAISSSTSRAWWRAWPPTCGPAPACSTSWAWTAPARWPLPASASHPPKRYNEGTARAFLALACGTFLMFDNLSDKLQRVFKNLRGEGRLSAENMEAALREIRVALLEADVNFKVVKQLIENIKQKAMGEEVLMALSPSQQVIKIVRDELIKILGSHESKLRFANDPPSVLLIVGLQGSGKTTSTGKLARWLTKNGHRPMMVSVDVYRPAAREQLRVIARDLKLPIYPGTPEETTPLDLARSARKEAAN